MIIFGLIIFVLLLIASYAYESIRLDRAYDFKNSIINSAYDFKTDGLTEDEFNDKLKRASQICRKWSLSDLMHSFKPLKLENWFTEEEIRFIRYNE